MLLNSIKAGMITITLTPEDAQAIALACAHAHAPLLSEQPDDCRMVDAIGAMFDTASVAASLQNGVSVRALAEVGT